MSLLMKALEKAAQDRKGSDAELTIEPAITPQRKSALSPTATPETQQAATTIIRAGQRDSGGIGAVVRGRPLLSIVTLAVMFALGYGIYIYLQINNPGVFAKQSPPPARPPTAVAAAPAVSGGLVSAQSSPATSLLPLLPSQNNTAPAPLAAKGDKTSAEAPPPQTPAPEIPAAPLAPRDTIKITVGGAVPTLNPLTVDAYQALTSGDLAAAQQRYDQLLKSEPTNLDALLGLAAIATKQGDKEMAAKYYMKALELDPRNAAAQAGLLNMFGGADPLAAETRLKELIARNPSPALYFTLGNIYTDQQRWPDAQQAYFEAQHLQPDNSDYAYNLAVSLDHIGQPKLALEFYRRAVQLAGTNGPANFNTAAAEERIGKLQKTVQ